MFVKVNSTRHTAIGTLRRGLVYRLDENSDTVAAILRALMAGDAPALTKITAKQAKQADVIALGPQAEGTGAPADAAPADPADAAPADKG